MHHKKIKPSHKWLRKLAVPSMVLVAAAIVVTGFLSTTRQSDAAPFTTCDVSGYLYKYPSGPTQIHEVDMVTGQDSQVGSISGRQINAIGYNVLDNFIYGWDDQNDVFVRVHGDHSTVDELTIAGYTGAATGVIVGDVDDNGHYWALEGNTWYQIDLTTTPNPTQIATATPPLPHPSGSGGADWAFVPGTNALWRIMDDAGSGRLWSFDRTTKEWTNHTPTTPIAGTGFSGTELLMGAFYADPDGYLYGSSNTTGNVWRVNVNSTPYTAELVGPGDPSSSNDGARCALAPVPIDFGDAPSTYSTLLADGGPRHGVINYNNTDHTAPLMLGKKVDIETDGFPGIDAKGDDDNNIDDEEGVTHIVATPGTPTALAIPVTVTNNSSSVATLAGWVDLDGDTIFETGERVTLSIPANSGTASYELDFPSTTFVADSMARFRVFEGSVADPQPTGAAAGGEVEDVEVQVGSYQVVKSSSPASGTTVVPDETITYTLTITNTGLTDLLGLTLHDDLSSVLDDATLQGTPVVSPASAGTATVDQNELQFAFEGDVLTGQTVTVTYAAKVNLPGSLGDNTVANSVLAVHSNCHPVIENGQQVAADSSDCQTSHPVDASGLANTGIALWIPVSFAAGLIVLSASTLTYRFATQKIHRK